MQIYVSSKLRHKDMWLKLREQEGWPIISSWIDGDKLEETYDLAYMWVRYFNEISRSDALVLYVEPGLVLKGALIEVGAALYDGQEVVVIWDGTLPDLQTLVGTWIYHPAVTVVKDIESCQI